MDLTALNKMQYGVYIVSSTADGKMSAMIANTVFQVCAEPVLFAASISKQNFTYELIKKSEKFAVSALSEDAPFEFIGKFGFKSGRTVNKFDKVNHTISKSGKLPIVLEYAAAVYEVEVVKDIDLDTHVLFIGKVFNMQLIDEKKPTMTYDYYHKVKGGMTAKNAPTFIKK
ncbi:MAG: flavin reductase family protein [Endomicrobia bacterium]|nr:flavin reductase family protein [Endomicrobiia bacterium]